MKCKNPTCTNEVKPSAGYKPRVYCRDACRIAHSRAKRKTTAAKPARIDALTIEPGDSGLVDRVAAVVASQVDVARDDVAGAQGSLALQLAQLAADGSVSACRELRLLLLEMRLATDPAYEGEASQALCLELLLTSIAAGGPVDGIEPAGQPLPPGWASTARDGEVLEYLGREWMRLRAAGDVDALRDLEKWIGTHSPEISTLRNTGRWSTWPDNRDSL